MAWRARYPETSAARTWAPAFPGRSRDGTGTAKVAFGRFGAASPRLRSPFDGADAILRSRRIIGKPVRRRRCPRNGNEPPLDETSRSPETSRRERFRPFAAGVTAECAGADRHSVEPGASCVASPCSSVSRQRPAWSRSMTVNPNDRARPPAGETTPDAASASPEAVFLAWLLWLPPGREPRQAARAELARIDRHPRPLPPSARRLRAMFATLLAPEPASSGERSPSR